MRYDEGWLKLEAIFALGWFQPSRRAKLVIISSQEWERNTRATNDQKKKKTFDYIQRMGFDGRLYRGHY